MQSDRLTHNATEPGSSAFEASELLTSSYRRGRESHNTVTQVSFLIYNSVLMQVLKYKASQRQQRQLYMFQNTIFLVILVHFCWIWTKTHIWRVVSYLKRHRPLILCHLDASVLTMAVQSLHTRCLCTPNLLKSFLCIQKQHWCTKFLFFKLYDFTAFQTVVFLFWQILCKATHFVRTPKRLVFEIVLL